MCGCMFICMCLYVCKYMCVSVCLRGWEWGLGCVWQSDRRIKPLSSPRFDIHCVYRSILQKIKSTFIQSRSEARGATIRSKMKFHLNILRLLSKFPPVSSTSDGRGRAASSPPWGQVLCLHHPTGLRFPLKIPVISFPTFPVVVFCRSVHTDTPYLFVCCLPPLLASK